MAAIVQLCMYLIIRDTTYYLTPASILPKAYSNSLLVLLNNRNVLRRQQAEGTITIPSANHSNSQGRRPIQVNIAQESYIDHPSIAMVNLSTDKVSSSSPQFSDKKSYASHVVPQSHVEDFGIAK